MILARIRIEGDDHDWFKGECEFPVLPPIGSTIAVVDRNANERELTVTNMVIEGVMIEAKAELPSLYDKQTITLVTTEL